MFTKIITVDHQNIGTVQFHAYVIVLPDEEIGFAIYLNDFNSPLIMFSQDETNRINYKVDENQFQWIVKNSKFSKSERKSFYGEFELFIRNMEHRAKTYLYRENTVNYISASREIIYYKNLYINANI